MTQLKDYKTIADEIARQIICQHYFDDLELISDHLGKSKYYLCDCGAQVELEDAKSAGSL